MSFALVAAIPTAEARGQQPPVRAIQATQELSDAELLDIGILTFDSGTAGRDVDELEEEGIFEDVRDSEAIFVAVQLSRVLESTGQWGAVRVLAAPTEAVDLLISGELLDSTGKNLAIGIEAVDATGRPWLKKRYKRQANERAYAAEASEQEPFVSLYNEIANDLVAKRSRLSQAELRAARDVATLQFAADLAPDALAECLEKDKKGRVRVVCWPAEGDPMMARIAQIRERDYLLVDTLNDYYTTFFDRMVVPYDGWRSFSYEEQVAFETLRRKARTRKILGALAILGAIVVEGNGQGSSAARDVAVLGGMSAIQSGIGKSQEAKIHREALRELGNSFGAEVEPHLVDVFGQTLRLSGSAATQYETWRQLLRELYLTETGFDRDPNAARLNTGALSRGVPKVGASGAVLSQGEQRSAETSDEVLQEGSSSGALERLGALDESPPEAADDSATDDSATEATLDDSATEGSVTEDPATGDPETDDS